MIATISISNCACIIIEEILHDIDDFVCFRYSVVDEDKPKRISKCKVRYSADGRAYFVSGRQRYFLDEAIRVS